MAEARDFHCYSHVLENLGKKLFRVTMLQYASSNPETYSSKRPEQTYSQLDFQTFPFLVPLAATS